MIQNLYGLGDYNTEQIRELVKTLTDENIDPTAVWYRRPDAHANPTAFLREIPNEEIPYVVPDALTGTRGKELTAHLSTEQLSAIGAYADPYLKETILLNLKKLLEERPEDSRANELINYTNTSPAWQL